MKKLTIIIAIVLFTLTVPAQKLGGVSMAMGSSLICGRCG